MTTAEFDPSIGKIVIKSDDITTKALLEYRRKRVVWNQWTKSWREEEVLDRIYDNPRSIGPTSLGVYTFKIGRGWAAFLAQIFKNRLSLESYQNLIRCIYSDSYRTLPFSNLRDYQNTDILHMMKYKFGLASLNTGYGKTECIVTLAHYFYTELGLPTIILSPQKKPRDELVKRYRDRYGENLPTNWDGDIACVITAGVLQKTTVKDKQKAKIEAQKLEKFKVVLVDECEYCINPSGKWILDRLYKADRFYGFSGSADRQSGTCLSFLNGVTGHIMDNKELISYFGPSLVHRQPVSNKVNNIKIKCTSLDFVEFGEQEFNEDTNVYAAIQTSLWTNPMVVESIERVIKAYPKLYIPINNIESIISYWVECWKGKFSMLVICGAGYLWYDKKGNMSNVTLDEAVELMRENKIDVIPSTSSGFRALDFPGLSNILLISGKNAGVVLQTVGRTARVQEMNILRLAPKSGRRIPIYSRGDKEREEMIKKYYSYCEIKDIVINEEDLIVKI